MTQEAEVLLDISDRIGTITLNAPGRMNTISGKMLEQLSEKFLEADKNPDVRCIILTGAGRAFCAGLDLGSQAGKTESLGVLDNTEANMVEFNIRDTPPIVLHGIDTPVVCALNGGAAGYGFDIALGCDIRIASDTAKMAPGFAKRGILPESGGTWLLPRIVGYARAAEIAFTGRTLSAQECVELGLVNETVPAEQLMDRAREMAGEIAANAPLAVRAIKRMMRAAETETFEQNVHHVFLQLLPLFRTQDFKEGVAAFIEKRQPDFQGR
jgi:enoyl-CoA hydratase/carnithine racemase